MSVILSLMKSFKSIKKALSPADKWTYYSHIEKILCVEDEIFRRTNKKTSSIGDATIKASVLQGFDKEHIINRVLFDQYGLENNEN